MPDWVEAQREAAAAAAAAASGHLPLLLRAPGTGASTATGGAGTPGGGAHGEDGSQGGAGGGSISAHELHKTLHVNHLVGGG